MAGDWLKIEKDTPNKPEIYRIAQILAIGQADAFLACFRAWCWADSMTTDGAVRGVDPSILDALTHCPGFSHALRDVGWLQARDSSLVIPNFVRHMGQPAKKRALTANRVDRHRAKTGNAGVTPDALPEKRREEKRRKSKGVSSLRTVKKDSPGGFGGNNTYSPEFEEFWRAYPRKKEKLAAYGAWQARLNEGVAAGALIRAACGYAEDCIQRKTEEQYIKHPATFLGPKRPFEEYDGWQPTKAPADMTPEELEAYRARKKAERDATPYNPSG